MSESEAPAYTIHRRPHRRRYQTARDMVLSLGAIGLSIVVLLAITWRPKPDPVHVVDPSPALTDVKLRAPWSVADPSPALAGWRTTVARADSTAAGAPVLALGWVTPTGHWVGLQESAASGADERRWLTSFLPQGWRDAVAYSRGAWRIFADVTACSAPCSPEQAPFVYATRTSGSGQAAVSYVVYGQAPAEQMTAVMSALGK